jgi:hypothetical protein
VEPFKLHTTLTETSGAVIINNTVVKYDKPFVVWTSDTMHDALLMNNLFVSGAGQYAFEVTAPVDNCFWDYNCYAGGPFTKFGKLTNDRYLTIADFFAGPDETGLLPGTGNEEHGVSSGSSGGIFASGVLPPSNIAAAYSISANDLRPAASNPGLDRGLELGSVTDGFAGSAPDIGCYEDGAALPAYGPR